MKKYKWLFMSGLFFFIFMSITNFLSTESFLRALARALFASILYLIVVYILYKYIFMKIK